MSPGLAYETLTGRILEAAFEVSTELGPGFLESVYEGALFIALEEKGLKCERQAPIPVDFRGRRVGMFYADLFVEGLVLLELKATRTLAPEHIAQTLNYLKATGRPVALLLNFGSAKLEYRRFDNRYAASTAAMEGSREPSHRDSLPPTQETAFIPSIPCIPSIPLNSAFVSNEGSIQRDKGDKGDKGDGGDEQENPYPRCTERRASNTSRDGAPS
jgi:GxxExxY protein